MIWTKTDAGRAEMQARTLVKERALRNLLLLVDGRTPQATLLSQVAGVTPEAFAALQALGLIEPAPDVRPARTPRTEGPDSVPGAPDSRLPAPASTAPRLDYASYGSALTQLIAEHLGLRGLPLTLAVERADTLDALREVARRAVQQIAERHGEAVAAPVRRLLLGA